MFVEEIREHLINDLIPFWKGMRDDTYGGFYGWLGYDLVLDEEAVKGCILNSRILWFFSNAYRLLGEEELLEYARHAFGFLKDHCLDQTYGGIYWSLAYTGQPEDTTKHTYNQAFAIYALSSYYDASGDMQALQIAQELSELIETRCKDGYGYLEAFSRDFQPEENDKLSENGVIAEKTMNTLLHVFEAYTELYRVSGDEKIASSLKFMLDVVADKVYNKEKGRQEVFFDKTWNSLIDLYSYGHDIETAWLVDRGLEILDDASYTEKLSPITKCLTKNIYDRAYIDHSLVNECENHVVDTTRVWWVQAEAVVGFLNGYQKSPEKTEYLKAAQDIWAYIREYLIDGRKGSEWYWAVDQDKRPLKKPIVEPWKCPYHNGRMCFEVIRRMQDASQAV
ncbi:AGE family epimerase/isomerase [Faecalicatena sp. AGMB00832]|uniref:Cellobiose 2-epimerase n=1 Tax=Faecalicatena faecalis TaxID=2726362 RepID=A0ABS6D9V9_9FIRM|nr:AGE family epimerase/isomerase [Faecalicatena faecalis]MBU3877901.1 AGE family epimerase/isomerase [Faecalicatena faecalis]